MNKPDVSPRIVKLKREAHDLKKREGIKHAEALNQIAAREGFKNWMRLLDAAKAIQ